MLAAWSTCAGPHLAGRLDARADDVAGGLVHVREGRVVVAAEAEARGRRASGRRLPPSPPRSAPARARWRGRRRSRPGRAPSAACRVRRDGWPARRSGRPGSGSSGGSARSRRRSATRRTPGRRGRSGRPCAGRYSVGSGVTRRATYDAVGLRDHLELAAVDAAAAKPRQAGHRRRGRSGCRRRSTRRRRTPRPGSGGPSEPIGVADQVEVGAQRDPGAEVVGGGHPAAGRDLVEHVGRPAAVRAGVRQKSGCQTCENGCVRHQQRASPATAARQADLPDPPVEAATPPRSSRRRRSAPGSRRTGTRGPSRCTGRRGTARRRSAARRAAASASAGEQAGGQEQEQHRARPCGRRPSLQDAPARRRGCRARSCPRSAVALRSRAAATRSARPTATTPKAIATRPQRRDPRRKTTKPRAARVSARSSLTSTSGSAQSTAARCLPRTIAAMLSASSGTAERHLVEVEAEQRAEARGEPVADRDRPGHPAPHGRPHQRDHSGGDEHGLATRTAIGEGQIATNGASSGEGRAEVQRRDGRVGERELGPVPVGVVAQDRLEEAEVEDERVHPVVLLDRDRGVQRGEEQEGQRRLPGRGPVEPVAHTSGGRSVSHRWRRARPSDRGRPPWP